MIEVSSCADEGVMREREVKRRPKWTHQRGHQTSSVPNSVPLLRVRDNVHLHTRRLMTRQRVSPNLEQEEGRRVERTLMCPPDALSLNATLLSTMFFKSLFSRCEKFLNMVDPPDRTMFWWKKGERETTVSRRVLLGFVRARPADVGGGIETNLVQSSPNIDGGSLDNVVDDLWQRRQEIGRNDFGVEEDLGSEEPFPSDVDSVFLIKRRKKGGKGKGQMGYVGRLSENGREKSRAFNEPFQSRCALPRTWRTICKDHRRTS